MARELSREECERVLRTEVVGRIGCHAEGRTYVVPMSFAYQQGYVYGHALAGTKIEMMRENPSVCFEVDHVQDLVNWASVIAWGTFEELRADDAARGMQVLVQSLSERLPGPVIDEAIAAHPHDPDAESVVFRIHLSEMHGRQEQLPWSMLVEPSARPAAA